MKPFDFKAEKALDEQIVQLKEDLDYAKRQIKSKNEALAAAQEWLSPYTGNPAWLANGGREVMDQIEEAMRL